jgi:NAD(P)-dependent dehydrogenase (short-subunit alcohol dehydrogenase family)
MNNPMDLTGRHVLVTGASSGIGRACALSLASLGARIVLVARDPGRLEETLGMLPGQGHLIVPCDLGELGSIAAVFETACREGDRLDGLVHAAGIGPATPIQVVTPRVMSEVMTTNFFSFMEMVRLFAKKRYSNGGSIVAISSVSGVVGWQGVSLYGASKGAIDSAVRALAIELAPRGIRVNSVVPSNIQTPMYEAIIAVGGEAARAQIAAKQPLGLGQPEDVANAAAFLLSQASRFITGTQLVVDGGYLAQ